MEHITIFSPTQEVHHDGDQLIDLPQLIYLVYLVFPNQELGSVLPPFPKDVFGRSHKFREPQGVGSFLFLMDPVVSSNVCDGDCC